MTACRSVYCTSVSFPSRTDPLCVWSYGKDWSWSPPQDFFCLHHNMFGVFFFSQQNNNNGRIPPFSPAFILSPDRVFVSALPLPLCPWAMVWRLRPDLFHADSSVKVWYSNSTTITSFSTTTTPCCYHRALQQKSCVWESNSAGLSRLWTSGPGFFLSVFNRWTKFELKEEQMLTTT